MSKPINLRNLRTILGLVLAGFAATISFVGITSTEISSILRNNEPAALIIFFSLLTAIVAALLAAVIEGGPWPRLGILISLLFVTLAGFIVIADVIRIPAVNVSWKLVTGAPSGMKMFIAILLVLALAMFIWTQFGHNRYLHTKLMNLNSLLIVVSVVMLGIALFAALRVESGSQQNANVQIVASDSASGADADLTMMITVSRLSQGDYVQVFVCGTTRLSNPPSGCDQQQIAPAPKAASAASCTDSSANCHMIAIWNVRPDLSGSVEQTVKFPISSATYGRVFGSANLCKLSGCNFVAASKFAIQISPPDLSSSSDDEGAEAQRTDSDGPKTDHPIDHLPPTL